MCVPIPPFDPESGLLPPGEHDAGWDEIRARFGWNVRRRQLLDGLADGIAILGEAGCFRVWLECLRSCLTRPPPLVLRPTATIKICL